MGYYSEVAFCIRKNKINEFFDEVKKRVDEYFNPLEKFNPKEMLEKVKYVINDYFSDTVSYSNPDKTGDMLVRIDLVKWKVLEVPERIIVQSLIKIGHDNFKFIRLGEDNDDNEEFGNYHSNPFELGWKRMITISDEFTDYPVSDFKVFND